MSEERLRRLRTLQAVCETGRATPAQRRRLAREVQTLLQQPTTPTRYESREVLAVAYRTGLPRNMLRHAVEVDASGREIRVLCARVDLDNLADGNAGNRHDPPTCPSCLKRLQRLRLQQASP